MIITRDTIKLLRIPFSIFLMPVFLLALSQASQVNLQNTVLAFFIIHLLVYPASNGYNSYADRDTASIGGLEHPPMPTKDLFYVTCLLDLLAVLLSYVCIGWEFSLAIFLYILSSRAYSSRQVRLKKYAFGGFLGVFIFQGAFTYYMSSIAISAHPFVWQEHRFVLIAASLQIAGAYPITQVYQHQQDLADGVITLSYRLGIKGTFVFTGLMFALCNVFYFLHLQEQHHLEQFYLLQVFFLPIIMYFSTWFLKVLKDPSKANFKHTMQMNMIASVCMSSYFILLIILNHTH
jgi:1,4-dihydroxy-2-naphthoate octaprenyltransferase